MCPPVANTLSSAWGISLLMRSLAKGRVAMSDRPTTTSVGTEMLGNVAVSSNLNIASTPRDALRPIKQEKLSCPRVSLPVNPEISVVNSAAP